ncbi:MAG: tRNA lysidine(34) synthetase TilS [Planctomycetia bacterium]
MKSAPSANPHDLQRVLQASIDLHVQRAEGVLLAVSGGLDSMALMHVMVESGLCADRRVVIAHLNHGLRGAESLRDAELVRSEAGRLGLPAEIASLTDDQLQQRADGTLEEAARKARYEFLLRVAREQQLPVILTAHHAADRAETVLHHIARGTGLSGLRGIPVSRRLTADVRLLRPLLAVARETMEDYVRERGIPYGVDSTNVDSRYTRNRIRHEALPMLRRLLNPSLDAALNRLAVQAGEMVECLDLLSEDLLRRSVLQADSVICRLDSEVLRTVPEVVLRHALIRLWDRQGWPRQRMSSEHWYRLAGLVREPSAITLPTGIQAEVRERLLILRVGGKRGHSAFSETP